MSGRRLGVGRRSRRRGAEPAASDDPSVPTASASEPPLATNAPSARVSSGRLHPPSIWLGSFSSAAEWHRDDAVRPGLWDVFDHIDDRMLRSRHAFDIRGHCVVCDDVTTMAMAWHLGGVNPAGSVNPAWTLNACCERCGLVSRMRALADFLIEHRLTTGRALIAERVTTAFDELDRLLDDLTGFEYLGTAHAPGDAVDVAGVTVRHDDLSQLSFATESFDLVITQDVFEHVPSVGVAFEECRRVLRPGGRLVFTVPCFAHLDETRVLARVHDDGSIEQLVEPPEIHGNPVGEGSLCLRHIGWDVLDQLRAAGFSDASAHCYWGPWAGHLGGPSFVYEAIV